MRNAHGCHDCVHGRRHDILGHGCDLCSWITSEDEHGNCEQWESPDGSKYEPPDGARRRTDDNLRGVFG